MRGVPGSGLMSNSPKAFTYKFSGSVAAEANAGRSVKRVSPLLSSPVVMLKGAPVEAKMSGLKRMPHGAEIEPPRKKRWRTSSAERPYSFDRS
jgi:hypothetical protein